MLFVEGPSFLAALCLWTTSASSLDDGGPFSTIGFITTGSRTMTSGGEDITARETRKHLFHGTAGVMKPSHCFCATTTHSHTQAKTTTVNMARTAAGTTILTRTSIAWLLTMLCLLSSAQAFQVIHPVQAQSTVPTATAAATPKTVRQLTPEDETDNTVVDVQRIGREGSRKTRWITCSSTKELIKAIDTFVSAGDRVAELGSQLRDASEAICRNSCKAVLVDVQRKFPRDTLGRTKAMRTANDQSTLLEQHHGKASFHEISSLADWRTPFFFSNRDSDSNSDSSFSMNTYDVLVLDVNSIVGNDLPWTSLEIVRDFLALNDAVGGGTENQARCKTVLIKSTQLNRLATRLIHGRQWTERGPLESQIVPYLVATVGVQEYRSTMDRAIQPGDAVLEVGCHFGTSTVLFHERASQLSTADGLSKEGYCVGVDVGISIIEGAKSRHPSVYFEVGDAWRTSDLLDIQQRFLATRPDLPSDTRRKGFDVVYVDVGGLSGSDGLLEALTLLSSLEYALEPRCLVIKSLCMRRLSSRLVPFWKMSERRQGSTQTQIAATQ